MSHTALLPTDYPTAAATHPGHGHDRNEDAWWAPGPEWPAPQQLAAKGYLYVVADGMGGHTAGDVASRTAVERIAQAYYQDPDPDTAASLVRAIQAANREVHHLAQQPAYQGMGATVVAAVVRGQELTIAHAGDSRAYVLRNGLLQPLTADHTWVAEKVAEGLLTPEEAATHPQRHVVTRSLGNQPFVEAEVGRYAFLPGDRLLLCTDGVWEMVAEAEIARRLRGRAFGNVASALVDRVVAANGPDDATALVVAVGPVPAGVLARAEQALRASLASPRQRTVLAGLTAGLLLLLLCGLVWQMVRSRPTVEIRQAMATPTRMAVATTPAPSATPTTLPSATSPTPQRTTEPRSTRERHSDSELTSTPTAVPLGGYCVSPYLGEGSYVDAVHPERCQKVKGVHIFNGTTIELPRESVYEEFPCGKSYIGRNFASMLIRIQYQGQMYRIFPWRIGQWENGQCIPIPKWRDFLGSPRPE